MDRTGKASGVPPQLVCMLVAWVNSHVTFFCMLLLLLDASRWPCTLQCVLINQHLCTM
jgi:hypothetical protein